MPKNTKVFLLRTYCSFNFSSAHFNSYLWTNSPPLREETPSPLLSSLPGSEAHGHHSRRGDIPPNHRSVTLRASGDGYFRSSPPDAGVGHEEPRVSRAAQSGQHRGTHLEAGVGDEARVVAEIGRVMLHHPLCLGLAEMFVRRGEAACREHDCRAFWKEANTGMLWTKNCTCQYAKRTAPSGHGRTARKGGKCEVFHSKWSADQHISPPQALTKLTLHMNHLSCFKIQKSQS